MIHLKILDDENPYNELAHDYWRLDDSQAYVFTIKQLQLKYDLGQNQIINTVKDLAVAYSSKIACSDCYTSYIYSSRSDFSSKKTYPQFDWVCEVCIKKQAQSIIDKKKDYLSSERDKDKKDIDELSITGLIYLIALIKHNSHNDGATIDKINVNNSYLLTPHHELDWELVRNLDHEDICIISDKSLLSSLILNEDGSCSYYSFQVLREVWVNDYNGFNDLYKLEKYLIDKIDSNRDEFFQIIEKISIYECIAYIQLNLAKRSINFDISERAYSLMKKLLEDLPVNVIWGIIFSSIKSISDYILQNKGTYKSRNEAYLAGVLCNKIESYCERALANDWELKGYNRDFNLPQSSLSRLVFNTILRTDDAGFSQKISTLIASNGISLEE